jgi:hypothetical protein
MEFAVTTNQRKFVSAKMPTWKTRNIVSANFSRNTVPSAITIAYTRWPNLIVV